jgi:hypothetical protein
MPLRFDPIPPIQGANAGERERGRYDQHYEWLHQIEHRANHDGNSYFGQGDYSPYAEPVYRPRNYSPAQLRDDFFRRQQEAAYNKAQAQGELYGHQVMENHCGPRGDLGKSGEELKREIICSKEEERRRQEQQYLAELNQIRLQNLRERHQLLQKVTANPQYNAKVDDEAKRLQELTNSRRQQREQVSRPQSYDKRSQWSEPVGPDFQPAVKRTEWADQTSSGGQLSQLELEETASHLQATSEHDIVIRHSDETSIQPPSGRRRRQWGDPTNSVIVALTSADLGSTDGSGRCSGGQSPEQPSDGKLDENDGCPKLPDVTNAGDHDHDKDDDDDTLSSQDDANVKRHEHMSGSSDDLPPGDRTSDHDTTDEDEGGEDAKEDGSSEESEEDAEDIIIGSTTRRLSSATADKKDRVSRHGKRSPHHRKMIRQMSKNSNLEMADMRRQMESVLQPKQATAVSARSTDVVIRSKDDMSGSEGKPKGSTGSHGKSLHKSVSFDVRDNRNIPDPDEDGEQRCDEQNERDHYDDYFEEVVDAAPPGLDDLKARITSSIGRETFTKAYRIIQAAYEKGEEDVSLVEKQVIQVVGEKNACLFRLIKDLVVAGNSTRKC